MSNKPSIPKGTRDFSPTEMARRNYIFDTIKKVYKRYGFQQIETPAVENLNTLIGTGGNESDTLIFKILNSGDYLAPMNNEDFDKYRIKKTTKIGDKKVLLQSANLNEFTNRISEKALRYDLTVPFARYVVQNQNDITFPFRRFQIQPVWRADRPQKGRYREFYQCDADIIGSDSLLNEVDLIKIIDDVYTELFDKDLPYTISINNRKILFGMCVSVGLKDKFEQIVVIIDKLDKIELDGVAKEFELLGLSEVQINGIKDVLGIRLAFDRQSNLSKDEYIEASIKSLSELKNKSANESTSKGIKELEFVFEKLKALGIKTANIKFDPTLARGLGYYTGTIIEVKIDNFPSICGGGRYDDLTGKFGLKDVSGVGISFGADRIYDVLLDNDLYPKSIEANSTQVFFYYYNEGEEDICLKYLYQLRDANIKAEFYPDIKRNKQYSIAERKGVRYVITVRSEELKKGKLFMRDLENDTQYIDITIDKAIEIIQK
jgi:histidyl-tRNA synthetase